jgi:RimJ/RimL family protein N-acetyltransferase
MIKNQLEEKHTCYISLFELKRIFEDTGLEEFKVFLEQICSNTFEYKISIEDKNVSFYYKSDKVPKNYLVEINGYSLRRTKIDDLGFICQVEKKHSSDLIEEWRRDDHAEHIESEDSYHFIIEKDGVNSGFIIFANYNKGNDSLEFKRIMVDDPRSGNGKEGLLLACNYFKNTKDLHRVWIDIHINNKPLKYFFETIGFVEEGLLRDVVKTDGEYFSLYRLSKIIKE